MIPTTRTGNTVYFFNEKNEPKEVASELWIQVILRLSRQGINACFLTCKVWKKIITENAFLKFKKEGNYFGKVKWKKYHGDIGVEPPLPKNIQQSLNAPCPFWSDKKVKETHLLVLVPETVNGKPFHLNSLSELIKRPKTGPNDTKYVDYSNDVKTELGNQSQPSHWVLMTRDVIPKSRSQLHDDQKKLIATHAKKSGIPYVLPTALEATTAILMHYVETGEHIYTNNKIEGKRTCTRCQEKVKNNRWPVVIGDFSSEGLRVRYSPFAYILYDGIGGLRKF